MKRRNAMTAEDAERLRKVAREIARREEARRREEAERDQQRIELWQAELQHRYEGMHPSQERRYGNR